MQDREILLKWRQGLSKQKLAEIYKREYNRNIRLIRLSVRHRHDGRYITNYESLAHVEKVIYKYIRNT